MNNVKKKNSLKHKSYNPLEHRIQEGGSSTRTKASEATK